MSSNPYISYYANQAGSGIGGFQGARFQRGQGFFGNVFKSAILPILKYFGKQALSTGADVVKDTIGGENFMDALKNRGKSAARNIASDAGARALQFAQTGKGRKRKRNIQIGKGRKRRNLKRKAPKRRRKTRKQAFPSIFH